MATPTTNDGTTKHRPADPLIVFHNWLHQTAPPPETPPTRDTDGGKELTAFVDKQLEVERARHDAAGTRGMAVITSSSALAALLFAASALVTADKAWTPPLLTLWALAGAFIAFCAAAVFGLMAAKLTDVKEVKPQQMMTWHDDDDVIWKNTADNVRWLLTSTKITTLQSLRLGTMARMRWAKAGWVTQLIALIPLAVAVGAILAKAIWPHLFGWGGIFDLPK